ncbi:alpha-galactosidase [Nocardioides cavernaquae]|uniref:alpha-galactosidase n=1 Tax=Nocardioides cavernaquae TaxID=2321396 RepID=A0A3A5HD37_9ACTN|nr:alpha-galactosidase [Nocardioides cavernaquae]RJS45914.1 alpha-galactosidase [Nocardioides cavernaquae]
MFVPPVASAPTRTCFELLEAGDLMPIALPVGAPCGAPSGLSLVLNGPGMPLLGEHSRGLFTRPHLRGHRIDGGAWSTRFELASLAEGDAGLLLEAHDPAARLALRGEFEEAAGGVLRVRYSITNLDPSAYLLEGLEVVLPIADDHTEVLDFTGRHERERTPQRHALTDGLWLREGRGGRPGLDAATLVAVGQPGFTTTTGSVVAVHVAWSGNSVVRVERSAATGTTIGGGEHLLPGEVVLTEGESYRTPWVHFVAADSGLDDVAAAWHAYARALPAHPDLQPVVLNVWEAVYFDHDLARLEDIADRAAAVGVERFVLDDGWFRGRRDDTAGLGDWWVDEDLWPDGLTPLIGHVQALGMEFGLWFEPEMVNPDSDLFRAHPDWILSAGDRRPLLHRDQWVLDLTNPDAFGHILERVDSILGAHAIGYVKWDHNRELLEAGASLRGGAPAVREQTLAFYRLLDTLRDRHPSVAFESCSSGGGRIDLAVAERVERFWTSDVTDALSRQHIQRWTAQLIAPEYLGAHISAPTSHATGRTMSLDFRAATALFGAFGIEWDLAEASESDLALLAEWVERHKRLRPLLHTGRMVRPESADPAVLLHGVVAQDRRRAVIAHVQIDESAHNRGVAVRVPGLDPEATYSLRWAAPTDLRMFSMSSPLPAVGPTEGVVVTGRALATSGFWMPRRRPETVTLVELHATKEEAV